MLEDEVIQESVDAILADPLFEESGKKTLRNMAGEFILVLISTATPF